MGDTPVACGAPHASLLLQPCVPVQLWFCCPTDVPHSRLSCRLSHSSTVCFCFLQVSRDEVREAVLAGSMPPPLQAVAERREAQQAAVRALVAAAAAGDEARLKVGGAAAGCGVVWCVVYGMKQAARHAASMHSRPSEPSRPNLSTTWLGQYCVPDFPSTVSRPMFAAGAGG